MRRDTQSPYHTNFNRDQTPQAEAAARHTDRTRPSFTKQISSLFMSAGVFLSQCWKFIQNVILCWKVVILGARLDLVNSLFGKQCQRCRGRDAFMGFCFFAWDSRNPWYRTVLLLSESPGPIVRGRPLVVGGNLEVEPLNVPASVRSV
ncbi:hypothetical protein MPTK1_6g14810 [Marchantia polymorpha subsp. ruderalis]|uniref:Uncharacterized protein n=2 Tax=Marchantia polymorpha TaxID=3197 RepID=A0AAF6BS43_MARPO|nr:hypothetical protein MARPO_0047s0136 [Marchantia polymorpha]BBN14827.1 hypothetical protein Mp_6g14810 [Marchantia polymorpha subsp. ruderalis]|eukprot:PTQ39172.1 hypothetical protein MARPO_0047s0136 [Marchantia polymorpha]